MSYTLDIDKIMLFGVLYTGSQVDTFNGNMSKAVLFWQLIHKRDLTRNIHRGSKRLKSLMHNIFELCNTHFQTDQDGQERIYFREPPADFMSGEKE
jgi:hypothetical protein